MNLSPLRRMLLLGTAFLAASATSFAQPISLGQKLELEGIIVARDGEAMAATALVPGLRVKTEGLGDDKGRLIATKVSFTTSDLETAQAIQAGLSPVEGRLDATEEQVKANKEQIGKLSSEQANLARRFGDLGDYDTKAEATVYFAVGSTEIGAEGQKDLAQLAEGAKGLKGYMIQVVGYADASGSVSVNQKLSHERSQAVVNWLAQNGRVVVKVLINRGIAGG